MERLQIFCHYQQSLWLFSCTRQLYKCPCHWLTDWHRRRKICFEHLGIILSTDRTKLSFYLINRVHSERYTTGRVLQLVLKLLKYFCPDLFNSAFFMQKLDASRPSETETQVVPLITGSFHFLVKIILGWSGSWWQGSVAVTLWLDWGPALLEPGGKGYRPEQGGLQSRPSVHHQPVKS